MANDNGSLCWWLRHSSSPDLESVLSSREVDSRSRYGVRLRKWTIELRRRVDQVGSWLAYQLQSRACAKLALVPCPCNMLPSFLLLGLGPVGPFLRLAATSASIPHFPSCSQTTRHRNLACSLSHLSLHARNSQDRHSTNSTASRARAMRDRTARATPPLYSAAVK